MFALVRGQVYVLFQTKSELGFQHFVVQINLSGSGILFHLEKEKNQKTNLPNKQTKTKPGVNRIIEISLLN